MFITENSSHTQLAIILSSVGFILLIAIGLGTYWARKYARRGDDSETYLRNRIELGPLHLSAETLNESEGRGGKQYYLYICMKEIIFKLCGLIIKITTFILKKIKV